jgi:hypothetical protein
MRRLILVGFHPTISILEMMMRAMERFLAQSIRIADDSFDPRRVQSNLSRYEATAGVLLNGIRYQGFCTVRPKKTRRHLYRFNSSLGYRKAAWQSTDTDHQILRRLTNSTWP